MNAVSLKAPVKGAEIIVVAINSVMEAAHGWRAPVHRAQVAVIAAKR